MVYTIAQLFLHNKGTFCWTPDLQKEYEDLLKNPEEVKKLKDQLSNLKRLKPISRILGDLRRHKSLGFILIRVNKETGHAISHASTEEEPIVLKCQPLVMQLQSEILNACKEKKEKELLSATSERNELDSHSEVAKSTTKDQCVAELRSYITGKAREAFNKAGFEGHLVPWAKIEKDFQNKTQNSPGYFVPRIENPYNKSREHCEKTIALLQKEALTFVANSRRKRNRIRRKHIQNSDLNIATQSSNTSITITAIGQTSSSVSALPVRSSHQSQPLVGIPGSNSLQGESNVAATNQLASLVKTVMPIELDTTANRHVSSQQNGKQSKKRKHEKKSSKRKDIPPQNDVSNQPVSTRTTIQSTLPSSSSNEIEEPAIPPLRLRLSKENQAVLRISDRDFVAHTQNSTSSAGNNTFANHLQSQNFYNQLYPQQYQLMQPIHFNSSGLSLQNLPFSNGQQPIQMSLFGQPQLNHFGQHSAESSQHQPDQRSIFQL